MKKTTLLLSLVCFLGAHVLLAQEEIAGELCLSSLKIDYRTQENPDKERDADKDTKTSIAVDKVVLHIKDGTIRKIYVYAGDKQFTNKSVLISVPRFHERLYDALQEINDDSEYVYLGEILKYKPQGEVSVIPDDATLTFTKDVKCIDLKKSSVLSIDLKSFSDVQGLSNAEPNGLIQLAGSFKAILSTRNAIANVPLMLLQNLELYFATAKFDSKFKQVLVANDSVNRMSMIQQSPFLFGARLNAFRYYVQAGHSIEMNVGYQYNKSDLLKVGGDDSTALDLDIHAFTVQVPLRLRLGKGAGLDYIPTLYVQKPGATRQPILSATWVPTLCCNMRLCSISMWQRMIS